MTFRKFLTKAVVPLSLFFLLGACATKEQEASSPSPSDHFNLSNWKIQYPGSVAEPKPREMKPQGIRGFSNEFFYLDAKSKNMVFALDATAPGSTTNSPFVRSELREEIIANDDSTNWSALDGTHELTTDLKVGENTLSEDSVTVVQVHGGQKGGFTLLRAVFENKELVLYYKADNTKLNEKKIVVGPGFYNDYTQFNVTIDKARLMVSVNGQEKLNTSIDYWNWPSYFKVGAYPQTDKPGRVGVMVRSLAAKHTQPTLIKNP